MTATLSPDLAREWVRRWDAQQELYVADREERFAVIGDVVADALDRVGSPGDPPVVADLGCGPGSLSARLAARLPAARIVGVDADPVLLALGRARYGDRVEFLDGDLGDPGWVGRAGIGPGGLSAAVSTTALHWLEPERLRALYRTLARLIRPGGVFVDGDNLRLDDPDLDALARLVRGARAERARVTDNEEWHQWWEAVAAEPALAALVTERSGRAIAHHGGNRLSTTEHAAALREAGFSAAGTVWQSGDDQVLVAIR